MCFGKKPEPQYSSSGGYSEESIRPMNEKYAHTSVSSVSSVSVFGGHQHYPTAVPPPPPRQYYDHPGSRPTSRQSARGAVPNFSTPQPHQFQNYPGPMSQQSRPIPNHSPQFAGSQGPFAAPKRTHPLQAPPEFRHRSEPRPSPLAPKGHKRQQGPYEHVHRKIQGAQGAGPQNGQKLHAMQTMYVGGW